MSGFNPLYLSDYEVVGGFVSQDINISADTNNLAIPNYSFTNPRTYLRLNVTGVRNLTGIAPYAQVANGAELVVVNVGSGTLTLKDSSALSSVGNRFYFGGIDASIAPGMTIHLFYDATAGQWVAINSQSTALATRYETIVARDYGVVADGVTNVSTQMANAIAAAAAAKKALLVPAGTIYMPLSTGLDLSGCPGIICSGPTVFDFTGSSLGGTSYHLRVNGSVTTIVDVGALLAYRTFAQGATTDTLPAGLSVEIGDTLVIRSLSIKLPNGNADALWPNLQGESVTVESYDSGTGAVVFNPPLQYAYTDAIVEKINYQKCFFDSNLRIKGAGTDKLGCSFTYADIRFDARIDGFGHTGIETSYTRLVCVGAEVNTISVPVIGLSYGISAGPYSKTELLGCKMSGGRHAVAGGGADCETRIVGGKYSSGQNAAYPQTGAVDMHYGGKILEVTGATITGSLISSGHSAKFSSCNIYTLNGDGISRRNDISVTNWGMIDVESCTIICGASSYPLLVNKAGISSNDSVGGPITVRNTTVKGWFQVGAQPIFSYGKGDFTMTGCTVEDFSGTGAIQAIFGLRGAGLLRVERNTFKAVGCYVIAPFPSGADPVYAAMDYVIFKGNSIIGARTHGAYFQTASVANEPKWVEITDNTILSCQLTGIRADRMLSMTILRNNIYDNGQNAGAAAADRSGIYLNGVSNTIQLYDNNIGNRLGATQQAAVWHLQRSGPVIAAFVYRDGNDCTGSPIASQLQGTVTVGRAGLWI